MNFTKLKNFLDDMVATGRTPGCSVVVYKDGKLAFTHSVGVSNIESGAKMTGEEYFNIYSCSKVTTVTAGAQLLEKGAFLLSDPLYDYLPEYRHMTIKTADGDIVEAKNPITVGDLFTMSTGFDYNFNSPAITELREKNPNYTTEDFIRARAKDTLFFEPGTHWRYSHSHDLLGGFISVITGKKFRDYVKENIFDPLGMDKAVYHPTPEIFAQMAQQYEFVPEDKAQQALSMVEAQMYGNAKNGYFKKVSLEKGSVSGHSPEYDSGGAGIITTVGDYAKLAAALSCGGLGANGERILSSKTVELMKVNRLDATQLVDLNWKQLLGHGYGLGVRTHIDKSVSGLNANLGEFGWGGAAGANVVVDSEEKLGVFFAQHVLNPREEWYQPRLINVAYSCID